jgi:hypothetical protein
MHKSSLQAIHRLRRACNSLDLADEKSPRSVDVPLAAVVSSIINTVRLGGTAKGAAAWYKLLAPPSGRRGVVVLLRLLTTNKPLEASPMRDPVEGTTGGARQCKISQAESRELRSAPLMCWRRRTRGHQPGSRTLGRPGDTTTRRSITRTWKGSSGSTRRRWQDATSPLVHHGGGEVDVVLVRGKLGSPYCFFSVAAALLWLSVWLKILVVRGIEIQNAWVVKMLLEFLLFFSQLYHLALRKA